MHSVIQELRDAVGDINALLCDRQQKSDNSIIPGPAALQFMTALLKDVDWKLIYICSGQDVNIKRTLYD
ncbi:hypothetical protein MHYP_G00292030 [Metynnis hypsauchen]